MHSRISTLPDASRGKLPHSKLGGCPCLRSKPLLHATGARIALLQTCTRLVHGSRPYWAARRSSVGAAHASAVDDAAVPVELPAELGPLPKASLVLSLAGLNAEVHVFGVEHMESQPRIGEFILRTRPADVVVETAVCRDHGACPGSVLTCGDQVMGSSAGFVRALCQAGASIADMGLGVLQTPYWEQMGRHTPAEQVAYIAAFAVGARLVHGDRPKDITYRRLAALATIRDLDLAFGEQCASNFRDHAGMPPLPRDVASPSVVQRIILQEREAIMCKVLYDLCTVPPPSATPAPASFAFVDVTPAEEDPAAYGGRIGSASAAGGAAPRLIVAVVGSSHIDGLQWLWETGEWQRLVDSRVLTSSPLMTVPPQVEEVRPVQQEGAAPAQAGGPSSSGGGGSSGSGDSGSRADVAEASPMLSLDEEQPTPLQQQRRWGTTPAVIGLRRGLLESLLQLSATDELLEDLAEVLGPLSYQQRPAYEAVTEVYGTSRMLLAVLPPDVRATVCSGYNCDMAQVLEPLRQIRPINGGPGYSDELIAELRGLNYDL